MSLQFKLDENLSASAAELLLKAGYDTSTVVSQSLSGRPDADIVSVCAAEGRVLLTLDVDFADIRLYPPAQYAGIVVLRLAQQDREYVNDLLSRLMPMFASEPITGRLWIVEESGVRIRGE